MKISSTDSAPGEQAKCIIRNKKSSSPCAALCASCELSFLLRFATNQCISGGPQPQEGLRTVTGISEALEIGQVGALSKGPHESEGPPGQADHGTHCIVGRHPMQGASRMYHGGTYPVQSFALGQCLPKLLAKGFFL